MPKTDEYTWDMNEGNEENDPIFLLIDIFLFIVDSKQFLAKKLVDFSFFELVFVS